MNEDLTPLLQIQLELLLTMSQQINALQREIYEIREELADLKTGQQSLHWDLRLQEMIETDYGSISNN